MDYRRSDIDVNLFFDNLSEIFFAGAAMLAAMSKSELPNLELLRAQKGVTRREVGEALGFAERSVGRWENGESAPVLGDLRKLAAYFDVSVAYLIGEVNEFGQPIRHQERA